MKSNFKNIIDTDTAVLIDFHATWCGPCQTLAPILEDIKSDFGDQIKLIKIDVDKNKPLAAQFGIRSVPTLMLFKNGDRLWRNSGLISKQDLTGIIKQYTV